jgi:hypothetical protein
MLDYRNARDDRLDRANRGWKHTAALAGAAVAVLLVTLALYLASARSIRTPSRASIIRADTAQLEAALQQYWSVHHRYPPNLSALVPTEIQELPTPTTWSYSPAPDGSAFKLAYSVHGTRYVMESRTSGLPAAVHEEE